MSNDNRRMLPSDLQPLASGLQPIQIVPLALLDGYKVRWNRETVARDVVQNFFDEVADFREVSIDVDHKQRTVTVKGPSQFDFDYMKYIGGTTKADPKKRTAGGFGEGLKVCALVLLRDYGCSMTVGSGSWEAKCVLRPMKLGRELCYELRHLPDGQAHPGSFVHLTGADKALREAFASAKDLFRHPDNPRLQKPIYVDEQAGIGIYEGHNDHHGHLYYRRQHRGWLKFKDGGAMTFCYDDRLDKLEGDRDRRNLAAAAPLVAAMVKSVPSEILEQMIRRLRASWKGGSRLLTLFVSEAAHRGLKITFPRRWLARIKHAFWLHEHAERTGFHLGMPALATVGMPTVEDRFGKLAEPRDPTALELARMNIARDLYRFLAREEPLFRRFQVADIGHDHRADWDNRYCIVRAIDLSGSFEGGITACLAALATGAGLKTRRNGDRLTHLLAGAVQKAGTLQRYARRWQAAASDPSQEALEPMPSEEEVEPRGRSNRRFPIQILAPEGFPPAKTLHERLRILCKQEQVPFWVLPWGVHGPHTAMVGYAHGIPTVWIGSHEIEPRKGAKLSYSVRTFTQPDGTQGLLPTDDVLRAAIVAEAKRASKQRRGRRHAYLHRHSELGYAAFLRWLQKHHPAKHREYVAKDALNTAASEWPDHHEVWQISTLAREMAEKRILARTEEDPITYNDTAKVLLADAHKAVAALIQKLQQVAPGLAQDSPPSHRALREVLDQVIAQFKKDVPLQAALDNLIAAAAPILDLCLVIESVPLDSTCARSCENEATCLFWKEFDARQTDGQADATAAAAAFQRARERLDAAIERAIARHDERDDDDEPLACGGLGNVLKQLFRPEEAAKKDEPSEVALAVREAWDKAIAEGLSEIEAAKRCLDAARAFEEI